MVQQYGEQCNDVRWCIMWRNDKNILNICFVSFLWCKLRVLEAAISHAYPEQGRDNVVLYCLPVHPHSLWEGGTTQECCAAKNTHLTHEEQNLVPSHTAKYIFKWIQKWEKCTCYRKILRKYVIKEMDYAILNIFKCMAQKKMLGYNIYSLGGHWHPLYF